MKRKHSGNQINDGISVKRQKSTSGWHQYLKERGQTDGTIHY